MKTTNNILRKTNSEGGINMKHSFMKVIISMMLVVASIFSMAVVSSAAENKSNNIWYICFNKYDIHIYKNYEYVNYGSDTVIVNYTGKEPNVIIPEKMNGRDVTMIWSGAFHNSNIVSITIPKTINKIGKYVGLNEDDKMFITNRQIFMDCNNLQNIYVKKGNKYFESISGVLYSINGEEKKLEYYPGKKKAPKNIAEGTTAISDTFIGRKDITEISFPKTLKTIDQEAFHNCTNLKKVSFSEGVETIGDMAFASTNLENINIPDSITTIGISCFEKCTNLKNVTLGKNLKSIGPSAFNKCTALKSIVIPDKVTKIGNYAFIGCTSLESAIINAKTIGGSAFLDCTNLKKVTLGDRVKTIRECAFLECTNLESIVIPDTVTTIGDHAFIRCTKLKNVTIGRNVKSIGLGAFCDAGIKTLIIKNKDIQINGSFDWNKINNVYFSGTEKEWKNITKYFKGTLYTNCKFASITKQPTSVKAAAGKKVKLSVEATGSGLKYQWQYLNTTSGKWVNIKSATKATLTVKMSESAVRTWRCVVTDKYGTTATSKEVKTLLK